MAAWACAPQLALGQGCVASRGAGVCNVHPDAFTSETLPPESGFQASVGYRWLHSDRHFTGDHEDVERQEEGSEVINDSHFVDLGVTYAINRRFSVTLTVPFAFHDRSQVVRNAQREILGRFSTQSAGLGDLRLTGSAWLLNPATHTKGNVLLGVGLDMPTGQDDVRDTFAAFDRTTETIIAQRRTVDQSIQLGDGGWGISLDLYAYQQIVPRLSAYASGTYAITPEEKNGVPTFRSSPFEAVMSIADSYTGRVGLDYVLLPSAGLVLSLGGRIDGVPVWDAVGGSAGFRRPGFSIAIEPGISAMVKTWSFNLYTPVAMYRNRERSVPDMQQTAATGISRHGDAAFADYQVLFSVTKRL